MSQIRTVKTQAEFNNLRYGSWPKPLSDEDLGKLLPQEFRLECCHVETRTEYVIILEKQEGYNNEALGWHCTVLIHGHFEYVGKQRGPDGWVDLVQSAVRVAARSAGSESRRVRLDLSDWK